MDRLKKDLNVIEHILAYCGEIEQTVTRFGNTFESFETDKIYRNAVTMCILQIGEAVPQWCPYSLKPYKESKGNIKQYSLSLKFTVLFPDFFSNIPNYEEVNPRISVSIFLFIIFSRD